MKKTILTISIFVFSYSFGQYTRQPYQYAPPAKLDISVLGNATTTLQNRYNNNREEVQNTVNKIYRELNNLDITEEQNVRIKRRFSKAIDDNINNSSINLSSTSATNNVIDWLYTTVNKIVKQEIE